MSTQEHKTRQSIDRIIDILVFGAVDELVAAQGYLSAIITGKYPLDDSRAASSLLTLINNRLN